MPLLIKGKGERGRQLNTKIRFNGNFVTYCGTDSLGAEFNSQNSMVFATSGNTGEILSANEFNLVTVTVNEDALQGI